MISHRFCDLGNGITINMPNIRLISDIENPNKYSPDVMDDYFLVSPKIVVYYLPEHDITVQKMAKEFLKTSVFEPKSFKLQMICRNQRSGFYLKPITIRKPLISDLALHYGEDFINIHGKILKELNKKDGKGIVLLHGIPGSGKLRFIFILHMYILFLLSI